MPPTLMFAKFRTTRLEDLLFMVSMHQIIRVEIGVGRGGRTGVCYCIGYTSQLPPTLSKPTRPPVYMGDFRKEILNTSILADKLKDGPIALIMGRKDAVGKPAPKIFYMWQATGEEIDVEDTKLIPVSKSPTPPVVTASPPPAAIATPVPSNVVVLERPRVIESPQPPPRRPLGLLVDDGRAVRSTSSHTETRTRIARGNTPRDSSFGQSFSLSGILSVDLLPHEHHLTEYELIEAPEVEAIINKALQDAYGDRIKTLRVRIIGT